MGELRDKLRAKALATAPKFKSVLIEFEGATYEVRAPSIRDAATISEAAGLTRHRQKAKGETEADVRVDRYLVTAITLLTFVPGTDERVFTKADEEVLMGMPSDSGLIEVLGEAATGFLKAAKEDAKNSERTPSA